MPECCLLNFHADSDYFHLATQMCNQDEGVSAREYWEMAGNMSKIWKPVT